MQYDVSRIAMKWFQRQQCTRDHHIPRKNMFGFLTISFTHVCLTYLYLSWIERKFEKSFQLVAATVKPHLHTIWLMYYTALADQRHRIVLAYWLNNYMNATWLVESGEFPVVGNQVTQDYPGRVCHYRQLHPVPGGSRKTNIYSNSYSMCSRNIDSGLTAVYECHTVSWRDNARRFENSNRRRGYGYGRLQWRS